MISVLRRDSRLDELSQSILPGSLAMTWSTIFCSPRRFLALNSMLSEGRPVVKAGFKTRLLTLLMGVLGSVLAQAQDFTYTTNNGAITITGYIGSGGSIIIPDTITGI